MMHARTSSRTVADTRVQRLLFWMAASVLLVAATWLALR
jgi:hypothetical protein